MSTRRAAFVRRLGGPEEIEVGDLPVPAAGPTDVRVRVAWTAVDHVDTFVRSGAYPTPTPFPFVIGRDAVGTVEAVGEGVTDLAPGDPVWTASMGHGGRQGTFAETIVVARDRLYRLPEGVHARTAVAALHAGVTAHVGLTRTAQVRPGETVVVVGAGGAVGAAATRLATDLGARVVAVASADDLDRCRANGADVALDREVVDLSTAVAEHATDGVDVWWDAAGADDVAGAAPLMRLGGRIVLLAGLRSPVEVEAGALYTRDLSVRGFAISNAGAGELATAAAALNRALAAGTLEVRIGSALGLEEAARAHATVEDGVRGKVIVRVSE